MIQALESRRLLSDSPTGMPLDAPESTGPRWMEDLGRGVVAMNKGGGSVYISWRLLGTDPADIAFNLYRSTDGAAAVKSNASPITATTDFTDTGVDTSKPNSYFVRPIIGGVEGAASAWFTLGANPQALQYIGIPLRDGGARYAQMGVGDLNGDGEYEYVVKWSTAGGHDPGSTHSPSTATVFIDAYKLDGTFMWRVNLGWNLEMGDDYTPMVVYDINGDGKAEVITKTAEGTTDGTGVMIGDTNGDGKTDYRDPVSGRVLSGPEFLSIYDGLNGAEIARTNWIARGSVSDWGDSYGNRVSRNLLGIAYLDGVRPSIVMCRGVYALQKVETWNLREGVLSRVWNWSNNGTGTSGNQCLRMGDLDGDGKDEIIKGSLVLNDNGTALYDTGLGHGDFLVISDMNPARAGLEVWAIHETAGANGVEMHDAATGTILWGKTTTGDSSRGPAAHLDPRYTGIQVFSAASPELYNYDGTVLSATGPSIGGYWTSILWDGDLSREFISEHSNGSNFVKWDYLNNTTVAVSGMPATGAGQVRIGIVADTLGDWREELCAVYTNELRVYTTTAPASLRTYTFMHDPLYRLNSGQWAMRNAATALPSFYFGTGMSTPPTPNIYTVSSGLVVPVAPTDVTATKAGSTSVNLAWIASPGATSYSIKRAYNSGGPFVPVAQGLTATGYTDTNVPQGTRYYYTVTALNNQGESANSAEASVSLPMLAPWTVQNIGSLGVPGRATFASGVFTLDGPGTLDSSDGLVFAYQNLNGDFTLVIHVDSQAGATSGGAGLMVRKSLAPNAAFVDLFASNDGRNHIFLDYRTADGGSKTYKVGYASAPVWLKLTRTGNDFSGYFSTDASTWTAVGTATISSMPTTAYVGLAGTGGANTLTTSRISAVYPTVVTAAAASSNPVNGTMANLSVLGGDDTAESNLSYTWSTAGTPPAPVSFSVNASNAAKNTTATFTQSGTYELLVTIKKSGGFSAVSSVVVEVLPDTTAPEVTASTFQYDAARAVVLTFSEDVSGSLSLGDLAVMSDPGGAPVSVIGYSYDTATHTATFTLPGTALLGDGNYIATLHSGSCTDAAGNPLAADVSLWFFLLGGDANHDRIVDVLDLYALAINWQGMGRTFSQGDLNYDGVVNQADLGILAVKWQQKLDPPASPSPAVPVTARPRPSRTPVRVIELVG